jgi:hypothetical protein
MVERTPKAESDFIQEVRRNCKRLRMTHRTGSWALDNTCIMLRTPDVSCCVHLMYHVVYT